MCKSLFGVQTNFYLAKFSPGQRVYVVPKTPQETISDLWQASVIEQ